MIQRIDFSDFRRSFKAYGRENNFSTVGLIKLFDYLEELERDIGEEIELDVIGLCCDFNEIDINDIKNETIITSSFVPVLFYNPK